MPDLIDWIKSNAREGANIAEAEEMVNRIDLNKAITNKDQALDFMRGNDYFKSALDSETSKRVDKFRDETMPLRLEEQKKSMRDEILKELNPDETPEQKEIRELKEWKNQQLENQRREGVKSELKEIAKKYGVNEKLAERYAYYGEEAKSMFESDAKLYQESFKSALDSEIKNRFGNQSPQQTVVKDPSKVMAHADFDRLSPSSKMDFIRGGGQVE